METQGSQTASAPPELAIVAALLEPSATGNSHVTDVLVRFSLRVEILLANSLDLLIPCEYNRQIKKRGKGSELYPQNPRKVGRKVQFYSSSSRLPGTSVINLPEGDEERISPETASHPASPSSDAEAPFTVKVSPTSVGSNMKENIKSLGDYSAQEPAPDPYAALMKLAATSEQHHQLSEAQRTTAHSSNLKHLKRQHSDDSLKNGVPRKSISIPSLSQEKSSAIQASRWGSLHSTGVYPDQDSPSYHNSQIMNNLPAITDIKSVQKDVTTEVDNTIPQSPTNLPSITSTPLLADSPADATILPPTEISRLQQPKSRLSTPGSETPHWHLKSPFSASDIINSMFDRGNISGTTPQITSTSASAENSKRNSIPGSPWPLDKAKTYPVLDPIISEIDFMPIPLVSEFLEIYFTNHAYAVAPIIRRCSLLSFDKPRKCSPVLLYSILYVSAHVCNHPLITSAPDFKSGLKAKLLDRLMSYMRPWRNDNSHEYDLDEIIAYINVGVVSSASEFKGSSLRWWAIAWCMAKVLKLNKEIPTIPEDAREERRRTWWTLFMIDRHLALCYNRPCTLLDSESLELFFPVADDLWESDSPLYPPEEDRNRRRGPQCTAIEVSLFGMYLPLMTLLGGIIDIHFLGMSPVLGGKEHVLKLLRESYRHRLSAFQYSLEEYYSHIPSPNNLLKLWKEYCQCFIQVFHILLEGFWDPTEMLDDIDVILNDSKFTGCLANSIQASKHVLRILALDSDLELMPFFFGVQLLQAGFIPFCMSERYGSHTSTDVAQACDVYVRAHEVCILTLNTQYQVNFRFIMTGVIRDMKPGAVSVNDRIDSTRRRRQIMSMYRWNAGGTGLAI